MGDERIDGERRAVVSPDAVVAPGHAGKSDDERREPAWPATGVVVGVDASLSVLGAVGWAAAEAARRRLPLHLVHVLPSAAGSSSDRTRVLYGHAGASLHRARGAVAAVAPGVPVSTATVNGSVGPALVSYAAHAHLLVVGSHRRDGPIRLAAGRVLAEVTAHAECPAVVVPPKWTGSWASTPSTRPGPRHDPHRRPARGRAHNWRDPHQAMRIFSLATAGPCARQDTTSKPDGGGTPRVRGTTTRESFALFLDQITTRSKHRGESDRHEQCRTEMAGTRPWRCTRRTHRSGTLCWAPGRMTPGTASCPTAARCRSPWSQRNPSVNEHHSTPIIKLYRVTID